MEIPKISVIPLSLEANSQEELIGLMWANNAVNGRAFNYMSPLLDGNKWVVWFYADIENYNKPSIEDAKAKDIEIK